MNIIIYLVTVIVQGGVLHTVDSYQAKRNAIGIIYISRMEEFGKIDKDSKCMSQRQSGSRHQCSNYSGNKRLYSLLRCNSYRLGSSPNLK